jgi:O-antigen/teichoic acid export membrane protein
LKLFLENFFIYGIGGIISKIVPIVMLPIVTRLMPNTEYFGLNDISVVIVSFGIAIAVMGMYDAMYRMFFEKEEQEYKEEICSSTLGFTLATSMIIFLVLFVFQSFFSKFFFGSEKYSNLLLLTALSILIGGTNSIVSAPTRMRNQRKIFLVTNTLSPILSYGVSIPLLLKGHFIIALPLASVISSLSMEIIFLVLNRQWFNLKKIKKEHIKSMLYIALPLFPNFLIYWIFNACDRLMIANMLGNDQVGIYAIGAKIGQVSQLIYTAFAGGWQFFAFSTMKDQDQVKMTSNIFEYLGLISFGAGMLMTVMSDYIFKLFFSGDYVKGTIVAPYLFFSPLLLMLFQVACNQFIVIKKTWPNLFILSFGALVNITINWIGIKYIGIEGAALGTLCGYVTAVLICVFVLQKMELLKISAKFLICVFLTTIYAVIWRIFLMEYKGSSLTLVICILGVFVILYLKDIKSIIKRKGKNI